MTLSHVAVSQSFAFYSNALGITKRIKDTVVLQYFFNVTLYLVNFYYRMLLVYSLVYKQKQRIEQIHNNGDHFSVFLPLFSIKMVKRGREIPKYSSFYNKSKFNTTWIWGMCIRNTFIFSSFISNLPE